MKRLAPMVVLGVARLDRQPNEDGRNAAVIASLTLFGRGVEMIIATAGDHQGQSEDLSDWTYESMTRARTTLREEGSPPMTLVLERQYATWQVVAMKPSDAAWRQLDR